MKLSALILRTRQLTDANLSVKPFRHALCHKNSEVRAIGKANEINLLLVKSRAKLIDQINCIVNFLNDAGIRWRHAGGVGFAGAAAIPLDDDKIALELPLKIMREVHCGHSRPAMKKQENWIVFLLAANQNVLAPTAERELLERCYRIRRVVLRSVTASDWNH